MNKLKTLFWRHRYGLIGTLFIHMGFVMYSRNQVVMEYHSILENQPEEEFVMDFSKEEPEKTEELPATEDQNIINKAFDASDERRESDQHYDARFNKSKVDEDIYNELKAFEKAAFDKLSAEKGEIKKVENTNTASDPQKDKNKIESTEQNKGSGGALAGTTTAEYNLQGRRVERESKPSYICIGSGTLVVNVRVNRSGRVESASVDESLSKYDEYCMKKAAEDYAKRVKFQASSVAPEPQDGTITYRFIAQ